MSSRARRGLTLTLGLGAIVLAACAPVAPPPPATPPPSPPDAHALCASDAPPDSADKVALVKSDDGSTDVVTFEATTNAEVQQEVAKLEVGGDVLTVEQDHPVQSLDVPVDPSDDPDYATLQYGFTDTFDDFVPAWNMNGFAGTGVRVAVVDSGVQADHPDLGPSQVVPGRDFVVDDIASDFGRIDGFGHGTHVAGTIAAADNTIGVVGGAPHSTVVPVRVLNCQGSGSYATVAEGVLWASDQSPSGGRAQVINLSLGGSSPSSTLQTAIDTAVSRGVVVVAAAGNNNSTSPLYPAAYPGVVAVGAVDSTAAAKASYSNYGTYVDVAAAGTNVWSTLRTLNYGYKSGTSMATPHVAAIAALVVQQCPSYTPDDVLARLTATAGAPIAGFTNVGLAKAGAATALPC